MPKSKKKIVAGVAGVAAVSKVTIKKAMDKLAEDHSIGKVIIPGSKALCTDTVQNIQAWCVANDVEYDVVTPTEEKNTRGNYAVVRKGAENVLYNKNVGAKIGTIVAADPANILIILPTNDDEDGDDTALQAAAMKAHEAGCVLWNARKKPVAIEEIEDDDDEDEDEDSDSDDDDDENDASDDSDDEDDDDDSDDEDEDDDDDSDSEDDDDEDDDDEEDEDDEPAPKKSSSKKPSSKKEPAKAAKSDTSAIEEAANAILEVVADALDAAVKQIRDAAAE